MVVCTCLESARFAPLLPSGDLESILVVDDDDGVLVVFNNVGQRPSAGLHSPEADSAEFVLSRCHQEHRHRPIELVWPTGWRRCYGREA